MATAVSERPQYKRSVKNYLIDSRFQLKYTGYIVAVTVLLSGVLGGFLWRSSQALVAESEHAVEASRKVSAVVSMQMRELYPDAQDLQQTFSQESGATDDSAAAQSAAIRQQEQRALTSLVIGLSLFVVLIGLLGIFITHKVAGPIYKMKLLLRQVGSGKLNFEGRLRKGDELQEFFDVFQSMVNDLKARQTDEVERLSDALELAAQSGASDAALHKIRGVRDEMRLALEK